MTLSPTALEAAAKAMEAKRAELQHAPLARIYGDLSTAAITAYLAQAGKEGWVMVPVEPTKAMMRAAQATNNTYTLDKWRAMLAAAQNGGE